MNREGWNRRDVLRTMSMAAAAGALTSRARPAAADEKVRHRILVENPAKLYDFPKS